MGLRQTIEDMCKERYPDPEIADAVLQSVAQHGTEEQIMSGELVLPTAKDAQHWHDRLSGKATMTPLERSQAEIIKSQDARLTALEQQMRKGGE